MLHLPKNWKNKNYLDINILLALKQKMFLWTKQNRFYISEKSEGFRLAQDNNVKVTDVQIWDRFISHEEMIAYTSCNFSVKGTTVFILMELFLFNFVQDPLINGTAPIGTLLGLKWTKRNQLFQQLTRHIFVQRFDPFHKLLNGKKKKSPPKWSDCP